MDDGEEKYHRIGAILDANPHFVDLVHRDLLRLSRDNPGNHRGRKAHLTSENILRALIVHNLEDTSIRGTIVRIAHNPFLRNFLRFGVCRVADFTFLDTRGFDGG